LKNAKNIQKFRNGHTKAHFTQAASIYTTYIILALNINKGSTSRSIS